MFKKILFVFIVGLITAGCNSYHPLKEANYVEKSRFEGDWYVIANIPYFAEKNKVQGKVTYRKRDETWFDDIYQARKYNFDNDITTIKGKTRSLNKRNTVWQSTFFYLLKFNYYVLSIDDNYEIMLLGHPSRDYGWVMSNRPVITEQQYKSALSVFADNQYDISRFRKVPQRPEDIGQKGYE